MRKRNPPQAGPIPAIRVDLPPLRERPGDVALLAQHFLKLFAAKMDKEITEIDPDALRALCAQAWPGNVRELANAIERAVVIAEPPALRLGDLPLVHRLDLPESEEPAESLAEMEKAHIRRVLQRTNWNISRAARILDVDRVTLYNKLKKYELRR